MPGDAGPRCSLVPARPDLSAGSPEIEPDRVVPIAAHRLTFYRPPGPRPRETLVLSRPGLAGITGDIGGRFPIRTHTWPHCCSIHGEHPCMVCLTGMHHHGKSDVADLFRHVFPDPYPLVRRPVEPVDAAVILLIQPVRVAGTEPDAMGVVEGHSGLVETLDHVEPLHEGYECFATVDGFVYAASGHGEVEMSGIARIDEDRVQLRAVRCAVLHAAHPLAVLRVVVDVGKGTPPIPSVVGAEEALRRGAGIPRVRLVCVTGREPECVTHYAALLAFWYFGKGRRSHRLFPGLSGIGRAKHCGAQMAGARRHQHRPSIPRIEHQMMHDMT